MRVGALVVLALTIPATASAESLNRSWVGVGHWIHNAFSRTATEVTGARGFSGAKFTGLTGGVRFGGERVGLVAEGYLTLLRSDDADTEDLGVAVSRGVHLLWAGLDVKVGVLSLGVGPGLEFYSQSGEGGAVTLNNGNSTQTFFRPAGSSTSRQLTFNFLAGAWIFDKVRMTTTLVATNPLSAQRRAWNLLFSAAYVWGIQ